MTGRGTFSSGGKRKRPATEEEPESDGEPSEESSLPIRVKKEGSVAPVEIKKEGDRKIKPKIQLPRITQVVGIDNGMSVSGKLQVYSEPSMY